MNRIKRLLNANLISTLGKEAWRATLTVYLLKEDLFTELMMEEGEEQPKMLFEWSDGQQEIIFDEHGNSVAKLSKHHVRRQQIQLEGWQLRRLKWAVVKTDPISIILDDGDEQAVAEVFRELSQSKRSESIERAMIKWLGY